LPFTAWLIELPHEDPADRFLAATALVNGFALATPDKHLLNCRVVQTLPNK
jgi:PIN domain nuclease of toxin-antitoxin system